MDGGASMVMIDIRYMWSDIDSPPWIPNLLHPSLFSTFSRSTKWKKGMGDVESSCGGLGSWSSTARTDHGIGLARDEVCDAFASEIAKRGQCLRMGVPWMNKYQSRWRLS